MDTPNMKYVLDAWARRIELTPDDRQHLERWHVEVNDPLWDRMAADLRKHGKLPESVDPYFWCIQTALIARRLAEDMNVKPSELKKSREANARKMRSRRLTLAAKMEEVVRGLRDYYPFLIDRGMPTLPFVQEGQQSLRWLEREAQNIREAPERKPIIESVRVSRQRGGRGKRVQSRELGVFMRVMAQRMSESCGRPFYEAVTKMTNIAFPDADVTEEDVRSACRPTTREGRAATPVNSAANRSKKID